MADSEQDKSELPTAYKLQQARRRGAVARGMDLGFLTSLAAFLACLWVMGSDIGASFSQMMRATFASAPLLADGSGSIMQTLSMLFFGMTRPVLLIVLAILAVTLLFEIVQTGVVFSAQPLKPDFSKLNPVQGLKRLFSMRLLIETAKNILKLAVYTIVGYLVIRSALATHLRAIDNAASLSEVAFRSGLRLLAAFLLVALGFALIDQLISRKQFLKTMRMSRRDVRREMRDREGDPRLRQKRKQLHGEFTKLSQSLRNLKNADVLIVNPQHIAVGLRYEPTTMHAPLVISMGTDHVAQRLKRLAILYNIPIWENPPLARALHRGTSLNGFVPESQFNAVADIYNNLRRKRRAVQQGQSDVA